MLRAMLDDLGQAHRVERAVLLLFRGQLVDPLGEGGDEAAPFERGEVERDGDTVELDGAGERPLAYRQPAALIGAADQHHIGRDGIAEGM